MELLHTVGFIDASVWFICLKQCTAYHAGAARPSGERRPSCLELTRWWLIAWSGAADSAAATHTDGRGATEDPYGAAGADGQLDA